MTIGIPLWPRNVGNQCLLMLVAGGLFGRLAPGQISWVAPLASLFLQVSQVVVMPFLICELLVGFGKLRQGTLGLLLRRGGLVLLGIWLVAALSVLLVPLILPPLITSEFFHQGIFQRSQPQDLVTTFIPSNIFSALTNDNFPAVVLFSSVLGILLQDIEERDQLLAPLGVIRSIFGKLNKLVVKLIPFGIFALAAQNFARMDLTQLVRMQGFLAICLVSFFVLSSTALVVLFSLTPLGPKQIWDLIKGPLVLTASSTNLLIALPMMLSNLQEQLPRAIERNTRQPLAPEALAEVEEQLAPLVSLAYSLPTLGQVASLLFIPFAAWYVDQALDPSQTLEMLMRAIPATASGIKVVMRQELLALGLPIDLLQIVYINAEWLYRFEKVLSLEGLVVLAVLVYAQAVGVLKPKPLLGLGALAVVLSLSSALGWGSRLGLAWALRDSYRNHERLMALSSSVKSPAPVEVTGPQAVGPSSLAAIRERGELRVGLRSDGLPWAYRNRSGRLVGLDVDLLSMLASNLGVRLRLQEAPLSRLEQWLRQGRLDLVAGGIQSSPSRAINFELSRSYLPVHLALVVPDAKVKLLQGGKAADLGRPVELAVRDDQIISPGLEDQLGAYLGSRANPVAVNIHVLDQKEDFFAPTAGRRYDGLLTNAESGAAWAVLHPQSSLITPFGNELSSELVLMMQPDDNSLRRYVNGWISRESARGGIQRLFDHWILLNN